MTRNSTVVTVLDHLILRDLRYIDNVIKIHKIFSFMSNALLIVVCSFSFSHSVVCLSSIYGFRKSFILYQTKAIRVFVYVLNFV